MTDPDLIIDLDDALGALLRARIRLGLDGAPEAPVEALDAALGQDPAYQDARDAFRSALDSGSVLEVEAAHNQAVAAAVEVGWLVAVSMFPTADKETP